MTGFVVCVDYDDYLAQVLLEWKYACDNVVVVTSFTDRKTFTLAKKSGVSVYQTDVFYKDGAYFNKGRALAQAYESFAPEDWVVFFDADIFAPEIDLLSCNALNQESIYGAKRKLVNGKLCDDPEPCGWFLLFHAQAQAARVRPIVDTHWRHAGNYDSTFVHRFPHWEWLDLTVEHIGEPGKNWCGRGKESLMRELLEERVRRGGWEHETI